METRTRYDDHLTIGDLNVPGYIVPVEIPVMIGGPFPKHGLRSCAQADQQQ